MVFSIIMPIFNKAPYLKEAVLSALSQAHLKELIAVDDGSTDGSGEIIDSMALADSRIKVIHQSNAGVSAARNTGIEHITGEYVLFLDADDTLEDGFLEKAYTEIYAKKPDIAFFSFIKRRHNAEDKLISAPIVGIVNKEEAINSLFIAQKNDGYFGLPTNKITKKSLISQIQFDTSIKLAEDWDFWTRLIPLASSCYFSDTVAYVYNVEIPGSSCFDAPNYFIQLKLRVQYKNMLNLIIPYTDIGYIYEEISRFVYFTVASSCIKGLKHGLKSIRDIFTLDINLSDLRLNNMPAFHKIALFLIKYRLGAVAAILIWIKQRLRGQKNV